MFLIVKRSNFFEAIVIVFLVTKKLDCFTAKNKIVHKCKTINHHLNLVTLFFLVRRNHRRQNVVNRVETIRSIIPRFTTEELELTSRLADVVMIILFHDSD